MGIIKTTGYKCERCEYRWTTRNFNDPLPTICPQCKTKLWNVKK